MEFYKNKKILMTGHTGFKGAWLCQILKYFGAKVYGYALEPLSGGIFDTISVSSDMYSRIGDIRDINKLSTLLSEVNPEIVFHLAAQPLVLDSYERPVYTFDTNIMGTANILECIRHSKSVRSVVIITTDKVYKNNEWVYGYRETDTLGGHDPYAASKACAEIVAESYRQSFLRDIPLSSVRAGNVIGGGDVSVNRIIPDCVRAAMKNEDIIIRNPHSIRPYQHVLEPLFTYLMIAEKQFNNPDMAGSYNVGPDESDCMATGKLADIFCAAWGEGLKWNNVSGENAAHEATFLRLDCSKMRSSFDWKPVWNVHKAIEKTVEWEKSKLNKNALETTNKQIEEYARGFVNENTK